MILDNNFLVNIQLSLKEYKRNTVGILLGLYKIEFTDSHFISITYE